MTSDHTDDALESQGYPEDHHWSRPVSARERMTYDGKTGYWHADTVADLVGWTVRHVDDRGDHLLLFLVRIRYDLRDARIVVAPRSIDLRGLWPGA
jgi:hypothetical protein